MEGSCSSKQQKLEIDYEKCIVCQNENRRYKLVKAPEKKYLEKLMESIHERYSYKDTLTLDCYHRLNAQNIEHLQRNQVSYHSECYKSVTNTSKIKRLKDKIVSVDHSSNILDQSLPIFSTPTPVSTEKKLLRSESREYNKNICIICHEEGGKLHKVEFKETGQRMLKISKSLPEKGFFIRMNSIPSADAIANDVQYHLKCWVNAQRSIPKSSEEQEKREGVNDVRRVIADIEIIDIVKSNLENKNELLDLKNINKTYNNLIGVNQNEEINYKRYLKSLLSEHIPDVIFSRPPSRRQSERICSKTYQQKAIHEYDNVPDDYKIIYQAAKVVRREILKLQNWKFNGDFSNFQLPTILSCLLSWIMIGTQHNIDTTFKKKQTIDNQVNNISQIIIKSTKSPRQVANKLSKEFRETIETPFSVGLALHLHKETRSKKLIDCLSDLGLSISYDKVMKIENDVANEVSSIAANNNGVYLPPNLKIGNPLHFAIDNVDFNNDTPDGKAEFHGTVQIAFQRNFENMECFKFTRIGKNFKIDENMFKSDVFLKPNPPNENFPNFERPSSLVDLNVARNNDRIWGLFQTVDKLSLCPLPTWNGFNSLITETPQKTLCHGMPLYPGTPTDWGNLYTSLKLVQGINVSITGNAKTIVTLDLQLYAKCMQMRENSDVLKNYIFRLGELHVVFAFLKVMGKYITGSGLDRALLEANIYGPATLGQIIDGKHMKRGVEAHMTIYLSLYNLYLDSVFEKHPEIFEAVSLIAKDFSKKINDNTKSSHGAHYSNVITDIEQSGVLNLFESFDESLQQQALFLRNYMIMYEALLLFIRSSREGDWELHLSSLDNMTKYFFAHDQINYARLVPLYLATMNELLSEDVPSWNYLKENFSISKSNIPFTSIGSDHALEQENKVMKVTGGIIGLTQNPAALYRFCLVAPILNLFSQEFCQINNISVEMRKEHYQLTGSTGSRIANNIVNLLNIFETFEISFIESDSVMNVVSKAVLPTNVALELLQHQMIGEETYTQFVNERIQGPLSVWSPMKKRNLLTFKQQSKRVQIPAEKKIVQLKEERTLLSRFLITARKRPEIDLEESIGNYEFSVVPKSMFTDDGQPLLTTDKSKIMHEIESLVSTSTTTQSMEHDSRKVIIIDGMALVNKVHKDASMKTWKDFAEMFVNLLLKISEQFNEVRLVFDRYIAHSLKSRTRKKRTSGDEVRYKISDTAHIGNTSLKQLLGHIETKQDLTIYLSKYAKQAFEDKSIDFAITYDKITETNLENFPDELRNHDHEEADTLLILHAIDVAKKDLFTECFILSPDTDVFLLLIYYHESLPLVTFFRTGKGNDKRDINIRDCYEALGLNRAAAILGFHVLTGCDQTGRFSGKSKSTWWKFFMKAEDYVLHALSKLGEREDLPDLITLEHIEHFIVNAYGDGKKTCEITTLSQLRWFLFSKYQYHALQLPPTMSALKYKIFRSHYICMTLRKSNVGLQNLPPAQNYGWELNGLTLDPILTDNLPAPLALIELSVCGCKGDCSTNRCKCFKNNLICTDMCKCTSCVNNDSSDNINLDDDLNSDSDSDDDIDYY